MYNLYEVYYEKGKGEVQKLIGTARTEKDARHLLIKYWTFTFGPEVPKYWRGWKDERGQWWDLGSWSTLFLVVKVK